MKPSENIGDRWASEFSVEPAEVEAEFDAEAAEYDQQLKDWDYRVPEDSTKILTDYVSHSAKVLDAGCGTGLVGAAQYAQGYRNLYGADLSNGMLEVAKSKGIYTELRRADLCQRLPYEDDSFDATTCFATLSFIEDAEPTFREFCELLATMVSSYFLTGAIYSKIAIVLHSVSGWNKLGCGRRNTIPAGIRTSPVIRPTPTNN